MLTQKKKNSQDEHFIDKNIYLLLVAVNRDRNIQRVRRCCSRIPLCEGVHVRILVLAGLIQTFLKIMRNNKVRKVIKIKYQSGKKEEDVHKSSRSRSNKNNNNKNKIIYTMSRKWLMKYFIFSWKCRNKSLLNRNLNTPASIRSVLNEMRGIYQK